MNRSAACVALLLLAAAPAPRAADPAPPAPATKPREIPPAEKARLVEAVRGTFDMSRSPRPYVAFLILDQKDNRYPSFWCGRNLSGTIAFRGSMDPLSEKVAFTQTGGFTVELTNAAHKKGMAGVLPGGAWIDGLRERAFRITLEKFGDFVLVDGREHRITTGRTVGGATTTATLEAAHGGAVSVGGKSAPIRGRATLSFVDKTPAFTLRTTFALPAQELGIEGAAGEQITATLCTMSTLSVESPIDLKALPDPGEAMPTP
jgi:hypothetical protein